MSKAIGNSYQSGRVTPLLRNKSLAIMTILATLLFAAVVTLQVMELGFYQEPLSVWPL